RLFTKHGRITQGSAGCGSKQRLIRHRVPEQIAQAGRQVVVSQGHGRARCDRVRRGTQLQAVKKLRRLEQPLRHQLCTVAEPRLLPPGLEQREQRSPLLVAEGTSKGSGAVRVQEFVGACRLVVRGNRTGQQFGKLGNYLVADAFCRTQMGFGEPRRYAVKLSVREEAEHLVLEGETRGMGAYDLTMKEIRDCVLILEAS